MNVFIAKGKVDPDALVELVIKAVAAELHEEKPMLASTFFAQTFPDAGGWEEWLRKVTGKVQGHFRFDVFVCTTLQVGRATAQIVMTALTTERIVLVFTATRKPHLLKVTAIEKVSGSWKDGWRLKANWTGETISVPPPVAVPDLDLDAAVDDATKKTEMIDMPDLFAPTLDIPAGKPPAKAKSEEEDYF